MKRSVKTASLVLMAALVCAPAFGADKASKKMKKGDAAQGMTPEMMEKWKAYSTPGAAHKALEPLVGTWNYSSKMWMGPKAKPEETKGTSESQWILGGRFVETTVRGSHMGQPFEGRSITGYDNEKKEYNSVWIDSMATGMMVSSGEYDETTKKLTETGTASCPFEGSKSYRGVTTLNKAGGYTYEMYMAGPDGKEFKTMELTYTKAS